MNLMASTVPAPSLEKRKHALALACEALLSHGITAVHDMGDISLGLTGPASAQRVWDDLLLLRAAQVRRCLLVLLKHSCVRVGASPAACYSWRLSCQCACTRTCHWPRGRGWRRWWRWRDAATRAASSRGVA